MKPLDGPFFLAVQMDVDPAQEALFHEVYETEHVPALLEVPGVRSVRRVRREDGLRISLGGELRTIAFPAEPRFTAIYELADAEVAATDAWARAVEAGRWPGAVRPFTANRRHTIHRTLSFARRG